MIETLIHFFSSFIDIVLHLDVHLAFWASTLGPWTYALLFAIIFSETGFVVTPFLPGDSLLFAAGALTTIEGSNLNFYLLLFLLCFAGIAGNFVNYSVGRFLGPRVFKNEDSIFLSRKHLVRASEFYEKFGGLTIILARFLPIIRTFAPFVAGIGKMNYSKFSLFNAVGSVAWVSLFLFAGSYFGNIPVVKRNFHIVVFAIIFISILPMLITWFKSKKSAKSEIQRSLII